MVTTRSSSTPSTRSSSRGPKMRKSLKAKTPLVGAKLEVPVGGAVGVVDLEPVDDLPNYLLLLVLYTLQGIPMGLSASIPLLIQQRFSTIQTLAQTAMENDPSIASSATALLSSTSSSNLYSSQALFALCSWPFSLKLLWAPIVDAVFIKRIGRRKSWLLPTQFIAGILMFTGAKFVNEQISLPPTLSNLPPEDLIASLQSLPFNIRYVTLFFFSLYLLLATQDIAVDGWALTMLNPKNRGKGPVCNSIGQNIGTLLSYTGFLALNDETVSAGIRRLLGMKELGGDGTKSLVSLELFLKVCGVAMCLVTVAVGIFKAEISSTFDAIPSDDEDDELDAADIGIKETYSRLIKCCRLPTVRWLVLVLLTYRFPVALSDNVKFLRALDYGLPKATVSLLAPTVILPLGILTPIIATKVWSGNPLQQFLQGYKFRLTAVAICDLAMLQVVKHYSSSALLLYSTLIVSTALQTVASSLQFNAQMTFFASRVDRNIGGSYMTLLNTFANLGGTWPASPALWIMGKLSRDDGDGYAPMQVLLSVMGIAYLVAIRGKISWLGETKERDWTTESLEDVDGKAKAKSKSKKGV
ncbi:hypothetical protein TrCOL_g12203 [Triparma columacea]|uniref:Uncharacterized protein n=1 Tax=Triparma columacea TaxID=722753 RepID=A0A9W7G9E2_9STRA|nr:hypothetical protein TrCOL_g12203 [Triparma columacea]